MNKIFIILCIFWIVFIAYNTSQTEESYNYTWIITIINIIINNRLSFINYPFRYKNTCIIIRLFCLTCVISNKYIRKFAHGFEFLVLALIIFLTLKYFNIKNRECIIYTVFIVLLYAVIDEYRQLYIPGRTSSVRDIVIDFIGGIVGVVILQFIFGFKNVISKIYSRNK